MPRLVHQHLKLGNIFTARFVVLRLLSPLGTFYAAAVKRAEPYDRTFRNYRKCELTRSPREAAVAQQRVTYVLVNNRSEGNASLTAHADKKRHAEIQASCGAEVKTAKKERVSISNSIDGGPSDERLSEFALVQVQVPVEAFDQDEQIVVLRAHQSSRGCGVRPSAALEFPEAVAALA